MSTALVLGGGGVAGVAWETGVLLGLRDAGLDLTGADLVVGTSAGSVVAAQITTADHADGLDLGELFEAQLRPPDQSGELAVDFDTDGFVVTLTELLADSPEPQELRRRLGAMAVAADTVPEAARRAVIEARLPVRRWPDRPLLVTAVDAATGEFTPFSSSSGADLVDAVGASCAVPGVWPPVTIGGRRYIDGGVRSTINADLAAGHERVVVVAPVPWGIAGPVDHEVDGLREAGARVVVVSADEASLAAFGHNPLDPSTRPGSASAGQAQAATVVDAVAEVWR